MRALAVLSALAVLCTPWAASAAPQTVKLGAFSKCARGPQCCCRDIFTLSALAASAMRRGCTLCLPPWNLQAARAAA